MHEQRSAPESLPWDDLRLFVALTRSRTIGEAARRIGVDPSTASRRLAALEEALATTLFVRSRDGITATKAAEDLLPAAEEVEAGVAKFARAVDGLEREITGVVRVTCPPDAAEVVLIPALKTILDRHPRLRIEIDPSESILDLNRREADLAVRIVRPTRGDLVLAKLKTISWVLAAAPGVAREMAPLKSWSDVPWIGCGERFSGMHVARWLAQNAPTVEPILASDSISTQIAAIRAGVGVGLIPEPSVAHFGLVPVELGRRLKRAAESWPRDDLFLVTHRALRDVPRVRVVWEAITESLREASRAAPSSKRRVATSVSGAKGPASAGSSSSPRSR